MKLYILIALALLSASCSDSKDVFPPKSTSPDSGIRAANVRHFNPRILGTQPEDDIDPLLPLTPGQISPIEVSLDTENNKYIGATVIYPKLVGFKPMRRSLNKLYGKYEHKDFTDHPDMGLWRNEDDRYAIQLTETKDDIQVLYLLFQPLDKVLNNIAAAEAQSCKIGPGAEVLVSTRVRDDGITEIRVAAEDGKIVKTYELNLSKHHSPATEKTAALKKWESYKYGAFVCFNSNQFTGKEFCRMSNPKDYNPTKLDVAGWIDAIKKAGMKYAVLTTRHTSGFLLWDSLTTEFDVAASGNKTDVVKEFANHCRKHGIAPGFYYCLWGGKWNKHPNARAIILAQLYELASNYGEIPYFWMDMMCWAPEDLSAQEIYDALKNAQPNTVVIFNQHIQDGTKIRYFPTDILNGEIKTPPERGHQPIREVKGTKYYLPFEFEPVSQSWKSKSVAKTPFGPGSWFTYGAGKEFPESRPFGVEDLYKWIESAYQRGANNVLLSLAPDYTGSMRAEDVKQLVQLGKLLKKK
ncbi:MAG: alpha-L-fucosidase [Planctomycetota bacterium]